MPDQGKITVARFTRAVGSLWPVAVGMFLAAAICWVVASNQTDQYRATATLLFHEGSISDELVGFSTRLYVDPEREAATNDLLVSLPVVAARASARLDNGMGPHAVSEAVDVQLDPESNVVRISATSPDATKATAVSNAYSSAYVELRRDADQKELLKAIRQLESEYSKLVREPSTAVQLQELRRGIGRLEGLAATQAGNAQVVQRATVPASPAIPNPAADAGLGAIVGATLGLAAAMALARRGFLVSNTEDLWRIGDLPVVEGWADEADAFRSLQMCAPWRSWSDGLRTIVVTAPSGAAGGGAVVAARLALGASRTGLSTVLADCDFRRPTLGAWSGLDEEPGLVDVLRDRRSMSGALQTVPAGTEGAKLRVLTAGSPGPEDRYLLEAAGVGGLAADLAPLGTEVLIISAPPISSPDLVPLLARASATVLSYRLGSGRSPELEKAVAGLRGADVPLLAAIATTDDADAFDDLALRETAGAV